MVNTCGNHAFLESVLHHIEPINKILEILLFANNFCKNYDSHSTSRINMKNCIQLKKFFLLCRFETDTIKLLKFRDATNSA